MYSRFGTRCVWVVDREAEHLVAWFEGGYAAANRFHPAGDAHTQPAWLRYARLGEAEHEARDGRHTVQRAAANGLTEAARTSIKTSLSPTVGFAISSY